MQNIPKICHTVSADILVFVTVAIFQRNDGGVPGLGVNTGGEPPGHAGPQVRPRLILLPGPPPSDEGQHR